VFLAILVFISKKIFVKNVKFRIAPLVIRKTLVKLAIKIIIY